MRDLSSQTWMPSIGKRILNHRTTRGVPHLPPPITCWSTCLLSGTERYSRFTFCFSVPFLEPIMSPRSPGSFLEKSISAQHVFTNLLLMEHLLYLQFSLLRTIPQYTFPERKLNRKEGRGTQKKNKGIQANAVFHLRSKKPRTPKICFWRERRLFLDKLWWK